MKQYFFPLTKAGQPWKTNRVITDDFHEIQVLDYLVLSDGAGHKKHEIIKLLNNLGAHDDYETTRTLTSMRRLQQILRDLTEKGAPIVRHPKEGVWIAKTTEELEQYADWLENKAKADISSMLYMRRCILKNADIEKQSLFDQIATHE